MSHIPTPGKSTIQNHFKDAQELKCLRTKMVVDVGLAGEPFFDNGSWYYGSVMIWSEGTFAEIKKCKSGDCTNCKNKKK